MNCKSQLPYSKRHNSFCTQSCSAAYNNKRRCTSTIQKQKDSLLGYLEKNGLSSKPACAVKYKICAGCGKTFTNPASRTYCSINCFKDKKAYRRKCKFTFTPSNYPKEFNLKLIEKHGWYKPSNSKAPNLNGVTFEHLYPVHKGFTNNVPPEVMRHPANAEILLWAENAKRYREDTQISLEELHRRIKEFDAKYGRQVI